MLRKNCYIWGPVRDLLLATMTIELLKTQKDAMRVEMNALEVDNLRLQSNLQDSREELTQSQEVNSSLKKDLDLTRKHYEQLLHGAASQVSPGQCAALEDRVSQLESFLAAESRALVEERAHVEELEGSYNCYIRRLSYQDAVPSWKSPASGKLGKLAW